MNRPASNALAEILKAFGPIEGRAALDVGCGHGRLAAALCGRGARVSAVDVEPGAVAAARRAAPDAWVEQAGAEALPFADASFDAVVMLNSLHHVPEASLALALAEMARVAKPDAAVVIVEPLADGTFFDAMRPVEDETKVRVAAQRAIAQACDAGGPLRLVEVVEFERIDPFPDVEGFIDKLVAADPARRAVLPRVRGKVERLFAALAEPAASGATLRQPHRLHRLAKA